VKSSESNGSQQQLLIRTQKGYNREQNMILFYRPFHFLLPISLFIAFQLGCEKSDPPAEAESEHKWSPDDELTLNGNQKWKIDDHTRNSLSQMRVIVEKTPQDELGKAMAGEISRLFEGCTMQGAPHDQLHIFLTGLLGEVNGLYSSKTPEERSVKVTAIRESLKKFDAFFE
jgi:hypothetical protein